MEPPEGEITKLLRLAAEGSQEARENLFQLVLPRFLSIAAARLRREKPGYSLTSRDLAHEAFLRLDGQKAHQKNRAHLYAMFGKMIRRVLIDRAKSKGAQKNGGDWQRVSFHSNLSLPPHREEEVLAIHECLEKLEKDNARQGRIVELRFFGGLSNEEIAEQLGVSLSTVESDWRFARAWLRMELEGRRK
ncbi:MAG TPA: ECF-type sigma factor [Candidatus Acidoferrales bacterium]|nr:ECF-type sigma factor [Candidatus Acidoferrales bacterium]